MLNTQAAYFRDVGFSNETASKLAGFLSERLKLKEEDKGTVIEYLKKRRQKVRGKERFGIVFDATHYCNLICRHCAVNANLTTKSSSQIQFETSTEDVHTIIDKVGDYSRSRKYPIFFMFGGGEPTLRPDFEDIVRYACKKFGEGSVGFNTNGTTLSLDDLLRLKHVSTIEISLDGFEEYHNSWRGPEKISSVSNPYRRTIDLVLSAVQHRAMQEKIEVTSIATKDNISQIPRFIAYIFSLGVRNYSIHRAMPVGRMIHCLNKIPNMSEYAELFVATAKIANEVCMNDLHVHHSLESIYSALLLGEDLHLTFLPMASGRHSIGIDPHGNVHFDPWCMVRPYDKLTPGSLLDSNARLADFLETEGSAMKIVDDLSKKKFRCKRCLMQCGGGMRFNAMATYIAKLTELVETDILESHLLAGLSQIDPACPLSEEI